MKAPTEYIGPVRQVGDGLNPPVVKMVRATDRRKGGERRRMPRPGQERRVLTPQQPVSVRELRAAREVPGVFLTADLSDIERRLAERYTAA